MTVPAPPPDPTEPRGRAWLPAVSAAAAALALGPLVWTIGVRLSGTSYYSHAPFYLAALAALAWVRVRALPPGGTGPGRPWAAGSFFAGALAVAGLSAWVWTPWGGLVAALLTVAAWLYARGGAGLLRAAGPAWLAAWLAVPPPVGLDGRFVLFLQGVATRRASEALDLLGVRHLVAGNTIETPGDAYFVEEACSGVNGLSAVLAAVALYAVWRRRGLGRTLVTMALAGGWVLAANAVRVAAVVLLADRHGLPVLDAPWHDLTGAATFAAALLLTVSTDQLLLFCVPPRRPAPHDDPDWVNPAWADADATDDSPAARRRALRPVWGFAAVGFLLVAAVQAVHLPRLAAGPAGAAAGATAAAFKEVPEAALPDRWGGWRRVGFEAVRRRERADLMGERSHVWTYRRGDTTVQISMDGPFPGGWHDLRVCYRGTGWACGEVADARLLPDAATTALTLERPAGRRGLVLFSAHALADDAPVPAGTPATLWRTAAGRAGLADPLAGGVGTPAYQVQALWTAYRPPVPGEREAVAALFEEMRARLVAWHPPAAAGGPTSDPGSAG